MRRNRRLEGIVLFIATLSFLVWGGQEAFAKGTVTIRVAKGGTSPKVFIVTQNQKGEQVRVPVAAEGGEVEIPEGARLEIVNADRNATIRIEGMVDVAVHGGSPNLQLSGDAILSVSNAVQAMQVFVETGNPTMISQSGVTPLTAGQQVAVAFTDTGVNMQSMAAPPIPNMDQTVAVQHPGETAGVPSVPGVPPGPGVNPAANVQGTPPGVPVMTPFIGMAAAGTAPNPTAAGTGLSPADIALLNSIGVPAPGGTNSATFGQPPVVGPAPPPGGYTSAPPPQQDPFFGAGSTFVGTVPINTTTPTGPIAPTGTSSAEQFVSAVNNNTTPPPNTGVIASPSQ